jgi:Uma2 family endonuclease
MPHVNKAELVEGVVYMPSPVSHARHSLQNQRVILWSGNYGLATPGVDCCVNATLRLDLDNEPQPDAFLRILPEAGGQSRDDGGFVAGAPELIVEIAASSVSYDLHDKLRAYQRNGVLEYVVWRVWDQAIDWFVLRDDRFQRLALALDACYRSTVFPGLWLDPAAMVADDMQRVMAVLQQGLATPEHADFAAKLRAAASKPT